MIFDYVILGGGSAGATLAARLSEDAGVTVCLVEAGREARDIFVRAPALVAAMVPGRPPIHNWALQTVPQPGLNVHDAQIVHRGSRSACDIEELAFVVATDVDRDVRRSPADFGVQLRSRTDCGKVPLDPQRAHDILLWAKPAASKDHRETSVGAPRADSQDSTPTRTRTRNAQLEAGHDVRFTIGATKRKAWDLNPHGLVAARFSKPARQTVSGYLP